ncbi:unnamed protein product [Phytophthora lilii]|uniref:Unnamed protein product n=1 Tax=Phytophthora lilii TaxID=2077276 RepID=A0A9W6WPH6_9STRA|nr:unnamed protein product [Phytophthora lilii]
MKLAKAAAQQLKAVVVEYDVLCATLLGQPQSVQPAPPGESWARERLQSALRGLPSDIVRRVTGQQDEPPRSEDELHLERQLQAAAREQETRRRQREQRPQAADSATKGGSLRDKYLHKLNKLKEKTKQESSAGPTGLEEVTAKTSAGLSTWVVNDGANEVLVRRGRKWWLVLVLTWMCVELLGSAGIVQGRDPAQRPAARCKLVFCWEWRWCTDWCGWL